MGLNLELKCPLCYVERIRFKRRTWFMRHLENVHKVTSAYALNAWFDACGQLQFNMEDVKK